MFFIRLSLDSNQFFRVYLKKRDLGEFQWKHGAKTFRQVVISPTRNFVNFQSHQPMQKGTFLNSHYYRKRYTNLNQ